jgi:hypothetical protein
MGETEVPSDGARYADTPKSRMDSEEHGARGVASALGAPKENGKESESAAREDPPERKAKPPEATNGAFKGTPGERTGWGCLSVREACRFRACGRPGDVRRIGDPTDQIRFGVRSWQGKIPRRPRPGRPRAWASSPARRRTCTSWRSRSTSSWTARSGAARTGAR